MGNLQIVYLAQLSVFKELLWGSVVWNVAICIHSKVWVVVFHLDFDESCWFFFFFKSCSAQPEFAVDDLEQFRSSEPHISSNCHILYVHIPMVMCLTGQVSSKQSVINQDSLFHTENRHPFKLQICHFWWVSTFPPIQPHYLMCCILVFFLIL